jgi:murein DD-endopeptidase MepM/ murein hydrolase activator NlpD
VAPGENLSLVAVRHGTTATAIARANGLTNPHFIRVGQRLTIPGTGGENLTHRVRSGDTLWDLSRRFGVSAEAIAQANGLRNPAHVRIGQVLIIPRGEATPAIGVQFIWPVAGRISSPFGPRWGRLHTGLDIAAPTGTPIRAAADGVVTTSRWLAGYGRTVILRHEDRTLTLYAHASKLLVRPGQTVKQGQVIARVGSTGNSTGPHLHFEVIVHGRPRDPMAYLRGPGRASVPAP